MSTFMVGAATHANLYIGAYIIMTKKQCYAKKRLTQQEGSLCDDDDDEDDG